MAWIALVVFLVLFFVIVRFKRVEEGTAIALTVFGKFSKIIFQWEKKWIDTDWNIWREAESGEKTEKDSKEKKKYRGWSQWLFGGLIVYFWPFQMVHRYKHRWTDIRLEREDKIEVRTHEEFLNHVLLKPAVYAFRLTNVETKPPERIPVSVTVLVTLRVRNPYLFLFVAPPTPIEDLLGRISAETRALITGCEIDELLQLKGETLWSRLQKAKVIEDTTESWGMKVAEKGIEIREIDLPPDYQKAGAAKRVNDMLAAGRAEELMGTVVFAVARTSGREQIYVQEEFLKDPQAFYQTHKPIIDNTMTKLSMENGAYFRNETLGNPGLSGEAISFLGALKKILSGLPEKGSAKEPAETRGGKTEGEKPVRPKSILATLPRSLPNKPGKPRKLTEEERARLKEELNSLPKEQKDKWQNYISRLVAGGYLET